MFVIGKFLSTFIYIYLHSSHRPIHINNFYNQRQIKLVCLNEDTTSVPRFEDVFQDLPVICFDRNHLLE